MERNPYSPPNSPGADIVDESAPPNRDVLIACRLTWLSVGLWCLALVRDVLTQRSIAVLIGAVIGAAFYFWFNSWVVSKLKAGRNWMRLFLTIVAVLGYLSIPIFWKFWSADVFPRYAADPIRAVFDVLQAIAGIGTVVMLNLPGSRAWFAQSKIRV